jgi:hypothetical protein
MKPIDQYKKFDAAYEFYNAALFGSTLPGAFITLQSKGGGFGYFAKERFMSIGDNGKMDEIALNPDYFYCGEKEILQTLVHEMCHQWQRHYGEPSRNGYHNKEWGKKMKEVGLMPSSTGYEGGKTTGQAVADYVVAGGPFEMATDELLSREKIIDWEYFSWESRQMQTITAITENMMHFPTTEGISEGALITVGHSTAVADFVNHLENTVKYHIVHGPEMIKPGRQAFIKIPKIKTYPVKTRYTCPVCKLNVWGKPELRIMCVGCDKLLIVL